MSPLDHARASEPDCAVAFDLESLAWLEDDLRSIDWNGPSSRAFTPFGDCDLNTPIICHLERVVRRQPSRIALVDGDMSLTFAELWDGLSGLAEIIEARTEPSDLVGILLPCSPLAPLAMLACLAAGRPFLVLDPYYPGDWLAHVLTDARPALIIQSKNTAPALQPGASTASILLLDQLPSAARAGWRPAEVGPDAPACVIFTSGSTGRPKGIVNSQRNLLQRVSQSINAAHINADDRLLTLASLCTIVGVRDAMTGLLAGAAIRLVDPQRLGAREILAIIRSESITILFAFPALLRLLTSSRTGCLGDAL